MKPWKQMEHYAALDWAREHHDIVVVDRAGGIVEEFRIEHTREGWDELQRRLARFVHLAIAVETNQGLAVEQLLAGGFQIYPVNPLSAERYRERKKPSGVKTDRVDAWSMADALRVDGHGWRALVPPDPLIVELRQLCRDEVALIEQRTAFIAQLRSALHNYYPAALAAFDKWTHPSCWEFVIAFPTPQDLQAAGPQKLKRWLHAHRLHFPKANEARYPIFAHAAEFAGSAATTAAKSLLAVSLANVLLALEQQLKIYRARIEACFATHPDRALFGSLPGAGKKLAPRLLSELGDDRSRFPTAESLQCYAGTAPISYQSGQTNRTFMRRACNTRLRHAVQQWAGLSIMQSTWACAYYRQHRADGQSHSCALRCLGHHWVKILWRMWQSRTRYDPELHQRNQLRHGSWVLSLQTTTPPISLARKTA